MLSNEAIFHESFYCKLHQKDFYRELHHAVINSLCDHVVNFFSLCYAPLYTSMLVFCSRWKSNLKTHLSLFFHFNHQNNLIFHKFIIYELSLINIGSVLTLIHRGENRLGQTRLYNV